MTAFVGCMIVAVFFRFNHIYQQHSQVKGVGWRTNLVVYYCEEFMCLSYIQHGFDEVLAVFAEYPGNTDNEIFFQSFGNSQFSGQFGFSVYV